MAETRARPLSPHLQIYRPMLTMLMSIAHRVTGAALYFGTLLVVWWLIAAASGPNYYATVQWFMGTIIGRLVLFGYTWALIHHMLGGVRHLIWDTGRRASLDLGHRPGSRPHRARMARPRELVRLDQPDHGAVDRRRAHRRGSGRAMMEVLA